MREFRLELVARRWRFWPFTWPLGMKKSTWRKECSHDRAVSIFDELVDMGAPLVALYDGDDLVRAGGTLS